MTTSNENEKMDIDLTNKSNNNGNDGDGEDLSEGSDGAENKGGNSGGGNNGGGKTTPTIPPHKLNPLSERLQQDFIPEEAKRRTTKDLTQSILRHPYSQLASMVEK